MAPGVCLGAELPRVLPTQTREEDGDTWGTCSQRPGRPEGVCQDDVV